LKHRYDPDPDGTGGSLERPHTEYSYDLAGNMLWLSDPAGNVTHWTYDALGQVETEWITLSTGQATRSYQYDLTGNLQQRTDRNGRVTEYVYDNLHRLKTENWLDGQQQVIHTISHTYDAAGQMLSADDVTVGSAYDFLYDDLGRLKQTTVANGGPQVVLEAQYNANGFRTGLKAAVGGTADFQTTYTPDALGRVTRIQQQSQPLGNAVAEKRMDLAYNIAGEFDTLTRYKDLDGGSTNEVITSTYGVDRMGRLEDLVHAHGGTSRVSYDWTYDAASRATQMEFVYGGTTYTSGYGYDHTDQITSADHTNYLTDEAYAYTDSNGNRATANGATYTTGEYNRLESAGTYTYTYDAEGNLTARFVDVDTSGTLTSGDTSVTEFTWDHRNRLASVVERAEQGQADTLAVDYVYDAFNRRIARIVDADGDGSGGATSEHYVYDDTDVVLDFVDADGPGAVETPELAKRYLWGPAVDQLLAQETADNGGVEDVVWPLTDNLGTVRDLANHEGTIVSHFVYDTFGNATATLGSLSDTRYLFTSQEFDLATGFYYYDARWYDAGTGKFVSEDPIGFNAGDGNLYRYVGNDATNATDPSGRLTPGTHIRVTLEALGAAIDQGTFDIGSCDTVCFKEAMARGAINPDVAYLPAGATGVNLDAIVALDALNEKITELTEPISDAIWESGKWIVSWVPPAYKGARWLRNWWQDSSILEPAANQVDKALSRIEGSPQISRTDLYQTHFGDDVWQHAMVTKGLNAKQIQDHLVTGVATRIEDFRKYREAGDSCKAGFALGEALHFYQDSWTTSHTVRNSSGVITRFQDFSVQSPTLHERGSNEGEDADYLKRSSEQFKAQVQHSMGFLEFANRRDLEGAALREAIRRDLFPISEDAQAGGTLGKFEPRNGR